jgi:hypothetical protein
MKAHSNYTTTVATGAWGWRSGLLLAFAALFLGLMVLWRTNGPLSQPTSANDLFARPASGTIASCRVCRDEWVAAQAANVPIAASTSSVSRRPQSASLPLLARTNGPIGSCRMCRDEWIAAQTTQSIRAAISESTSELDLNHSAQQLRISGPR